MGIYNDFDDLASSLDLPPYFKILAVVFEALPLALLLFVLSFLGRLKRGGLWSGTAAFSQPAPPPQQYQQPPQGYVNRVGPQGQQPLYAGQAYQYGPQQGVPGGVGYQADPTSRGPEAGAQPAYSPSP